MNYYFPRYGFWLYPVIYPLAVLGIERVAEFFKKYKNWHAQAFYIAAYLSIIALSSSDFYRFIYYG